MARHPRTPLEHDLCGLRRQIRRSARRLRAVSRALRAAPPARPSLRLLRGGLWRGRR